MIDVSGIPAMIMANGPRSEEFGVPHKCLAEVGKGLRIIDMMIRALHASEHVGEVYVIEPPDECISWSGVPGAEFIPAESTEFRHTLEAVQQITADEKILLVCSDLPEIGANGSTQLPIDQLLEESLRIDAEFICPIIAADEFYSEYPEAKKTSVRLASGEIIVGNLFLASPQFLRRHSGKMCDVFEARKSKKDLARLLGPWFSIRYLASRRIPRALSLPAIRKKGSSLLGASLQTVPGHPAFCRDIDNPESLSVYLLTLALRDHYKAVRHSP